MPSISARMQTPRILWGALTFTIVLYDLLLYMVREQIAQHTPPPTTTVIGVCVVAIAVAVMSIFNSKREFAVALAKVDFTVNEEPGEAVGSFRESAPVRRVVAQPHEAFARAMPGYQWSFVRGMAVAEAVALFGLYIGYINGPMIVAAGLFLLAAAVMGSKFPRVSTIQRAIERRTNAECPL